MQYMDIFYEVIDKIQFLLTIYQQKNHMALIIIFMVPLSLKYQYGWVLFYYFILIVLKNLNLLFYIHYYEVIYFMLLNLYELHLFYVIL